MAGQKDQVTQTKNKARVTKHVTRDNYHGHLAVFKGGGGAPPLCHSRPLYISEPHTSY